LSWDGQHAGVATLQTDRLVMRPFVEDDLDAYAAIVAEPEVCRYLGNGDTLDRAGAWRQIAVFLGHAQLRGYSQEALVERESGTLVGRAGLWQPEGWPGLEVGWLLAPRVWGRGYATEAGRAWRDYAFRELGAAELVSLIHRDNLPSARVAERIGHRPLEALAFGGQPCVLYGQSREPAPPGPSATLSSP
jgi:RimJ/RimL family protein N-acetyltransferase